MLSITVEADASAHPAKFYQLAITLQLYRRQQPPQNYLFQRARSIARSSICMPNSCSAIVIIERRVTLGRIAPDLGVISLLSAWAIMILAEPCFFQISDAQQHPRYKASLAPSSLALRVAYRADRVISAGLHITSAMRRGPIDIRNGQGN